jgi:hypothetical protein
MEKLAECCMLRAAMLCAAGGLPQPGPIFQALPEPLPLPALPEPFAAEAPETAPAGLPGPGASLQAQHHVKNPYQGLSRKLQQEQLGAHFPPIASPSVLVLHVSMLERRPVGLEATLQQQSCLGKLPA